MGFDPPAHLCSFEPKTISRLAEKCGFQTLAVRNAPVIINQDVWKDVAKILLRGFSETLYLASLGRVVLGYSTMLAARKMG